MGEVEPNIWQRVALATNDVVTPANAIDAGALALAIRQAPRLDTWPGLILGSVAYMADLVDGKVARATGTTSDLGAKIDPVGDKIKVAYGLFHIWRKGMASKGLIGAVAAQNAANAGITIYDQVFNEQPQVAVTDDARRAMFAQAWGIGLQAFGTKVAERHIQAGRVLKTAGAVLGWAGLIRYGIPSTIDYARKATGLTYNR